MKEIKPWVDVVRLHPDVESELTALSTYALDLGALVGKDPGVSPTYRDPYSFFRATHLTSDMKNLIQEVYERLSGKDGNRVLQLRSPFGGGKSHTLATLYYSVKNRKEMETAIPETKKLPELKDVRVAVFDGEKFDAVSGTEINGQNIRTLWGFLAYQLGSYELIKEQDQKRVAPGGELVKKILSDKPTLIILDEVSRYLERSMAEKVGESTLYRQAMEFLQTLTTEVASSKYACMVYSLQASAREFYGDVEILATLDHLASRVDAKREPIRGDEIFFVLRKRLLAEPPDEEIANRVADVYMEKLKQNLFAYTSSSEERREIEERLVKYRERFVIAYPFHPALIDLMRERWASIPDFQRTRGVLRFLAVVLRTLKKRNVKDYLISATDIPIDDPEVKNAFFTEVGQREPFQAVLEADFTGPNATVKRIDKTMFKDLKEPASKISTAILMSSFGGLPKGEGEETLHGITENDLLFLVISPYLDSTTTKAVLKELVAKCLYIHYDGARYAFKTTPNVNKLLEDQVESIRGDEIDSAIKSMLEKELSGKPAVIWPNHSKNIPDKETKFQIAYLPFDFAYKSEKDKNSIGLEFLTQYGDKPRVYKNGLALAIPDKTQVESLRRAVKYLIAIERIKGKKKSLNLTEEQLEQLKEREKTEQAGRDASFRNIYNTLWLLKLENGKFVIEPIEIGGRALKETNIHERLMELLMKVSPPKVFDSLTSTKFLELIKIEEGIDTQSIIDTFFSSLDFPRIVDEDVIKKVISKCVKDARLGLTTKDKVQIKEGKPLFPKEHIIIEKDIPTEEIDLSLGYIVSSKVMQTADKVMQTAEMHQVIPHNEEEKPKEDKISQVKVKHIKYNLKKVNRKQLYKCFDALGNLAEKCGSILIQIEAQSEEGIDKNWLKNTVEEPIEEAGIEIEREE
ncbi:ATP-binding protein [Thermocrinis sp.]